MKFPWAICLAHADAATLGALRLWPGVEVAEAENFIWVRGKASVEDLAGRLSALPALARYEWLADGRLRSLENRIPTEKMPVLPWQPIQIWLQVEMAPTPNSKIEPQRVALQLVRSGGEREAELLLTTLEDWARFALLAAKARLDPLRFAVDNTGRVLVWGRPLPPLPGTQFILHDHIAVPAGFAWKPAVGVDVLRQLLGGGKDSLILWQEDGAITRIAAEQFVSATRSAIRSTQQIFAEIL